MYYVSELTASLNFGVSFVSQQEADAQAADMDSNGCYGCYGCWGCRDCRYCVDCAHCQGCLRCSDSKECVGCAGCRGCTGCPGRRDSTGVINQGGQSCKP